MKWGMMSEFPAGWTESPLVDLIHKDGLFSDGDWIESKDQDPNGAIRLLQLADIGDGKFLNKSNRFVNDEKFDLLNCTEILEGDVLVARMPDPLGRACLMPKLPQKCITVVDVAIVRPGPESVLTDWLMHFLNSPGIRQEIHLLSSGSTRKRISRGNLSRIILPVPPLNEQKHIAEKLDNLLARVDSCQSHLERVPQILQRFRQSILAAATSGRLTEDWRISKGLNQETAGFGYSDADCFGDYEFPAIWKSARLKDIAEVIGGITKDSKKQSATDEELPYLRVANVQRGYLDLAEIKTIRVPRQRLNDWLLKPGDILFTEGGDFDKLGRGWVWNGEIERCIFQNHIFRARIRQRDFSPKYFSYYSNSRGFEYFLTYGKQTTNLASISKSILEALPVAVPPKEEQDEIVGRVDTLFAYAKRLEKRCGTGRALVDQLTPSLLTKAFRGELVEQDPNDEPAKELLERIQAARANTPRTIKKPLRRSQMKEKEALPGGQRMSVVEVLKNAGKEMSSEQLFTAAGYPGDATPDIVEEFFVDIRDAIKNKQIVRSRRGTADWFSLFQ
jgi:type I restriction enzyme S subunit